MCRTFSIVCVGSQPQSSLTKPFRGGRVLPLLGALKGLSDVQYCLCLLARSFKIAFSWAILYGQ